MASRSAAPRARGAAGRAGKPARPTADDRKAELMRLYGDKALKRLAWLVENADSEQAQVAAAKELLDRVAGRSVPAGKGGAGSGLEEVVARLRAMGAGGADE